MLLQLFRSKVSEQNTLTHKLGVLLTLGDQKVKNVLPVRTADIFDDFGYVSEKGVAFDTELAPHVGGKRVFEEMISLPYCVGYEDVFEVINHSLVNFQPQSFAEPIVVLVHNFTVH